MLLHSLHRGVQVARCVSNAVGCPRCVLNLSLDKFMRGSLWSQWATSVNVERYGVCAAPPTPCVPRQQSTPARAGNIDSAGGECHRPRWPACRCSLLTASLRSTCCCTAPRARPLAPAPSAARSPTPSPPPLAPFSTIQCSSRCCCCCRGLLRCGVELEGGVQGGSGGAAAWRLSLWAARPGNLRVSGGSGGTASTPSSPSQLLWMAKKNHTTSMRFFLICACVSGGCVHGWREPTPRFPTV